MRALRHRGIGVRHAVVGRQLVIRVVGGHRLAIDADAIAVAIVAVAIDHAAVRAHRGQPTAGVVGVQVVVTQSMDEINNQPLW